MVPDAGQVDGHAPLLEPAVLVSENCPDCRGTGFRVVVRGSTPSELPWAGRDPLKQDMPKNTVPCEHCEGQGRQLREVPVSELAQLMNVSTQRPRSPSPSELRGRA